MRRYHSTTFIVREVDRIPEIPISDLDIGRYDILVTGAFVTVFKGPALLSLSKGSKFPKERRLRIK
jgi:hypothetical protein